METRELAGSITEALKGAAEACEPLSRYILQTANHFRAGEVVEANELLVRVLEDFSFLVSLLEDVGRWNVFVANAEKGTQETIEKESSEMVDLFKTALEAQENNDWVFLADILEYEISEKLGTWDEFLLNVSSEAEQCASA